MLVLVPSSVIFKDLAVLSFVAVPAFPDTLPVTSPVRFPENVAFIVVGNLICEKMDVQFGEELGPDDFPTELKVVYTLQHGMQRDKKAI